MKYPAAIILSIEGTTLSSAEKSLFAESNPLGFILFEYNCKEPDQIRTLVNDLRSSVERDCPVLIDQEGGRAQQLGSPHWKQQTPAQNCNTPNEAAEVAYAISNELNALNIDVNCAPVMDVLSKETHDVIGDRAFSDNPQDVFEKGLAVCEAYLASGITPVVKHMPGHGRAAADSHLELPIVETPLDELQETDFKPFQLMAMTPVSDQIWGMLAHVLYTALDTEHPASTSRTVMDYMRTQMGVDYFLLADHISMDALEKYGNLADRAVKTLEAGCDATLYTEGILKEMEQIMADIPPMTAKSYERYERSCIRRRSAA